MAYNALKIWSAYEVLSASNLNSNMANLDFLKTQVFIQMCQGRLTLEITVPVSTSDQSAKTTLYFTPFRGNKIGLYDSGSSSWDLYSFTEQSLSLSGYIKGAVYDIFGYLSGGALALESLIWKKVTATNNPTAGSNVVINISDTGDLAVGREVTIKDGSNSEICIVGNMVPNVSITVNTLVNSYTTPDVYGFNTRATDVTLNNGIYVKSGDTTRRYLGTIRITSTAGQCEDSKARRYVWNAYNRMTRPLLAVDPTATWTYTTNTWRAANANSTAGVGRFDCVIGLNEEPINAVNYGIVYTNYNAINTEVVGIGLDTPVANSANIFGGIGSQFGHEPHAYYRGFLGIGAHYIQKVERSYVGGGTTTWYGTSGSLQSGMHGTVVG